MMLTGMAFAPKDPMSSPNPLSERLRFAEFVLDRLPNGRCRARVGSDLEGVRAVHG